MNKGYLRPLDGLRLIAVFFVMLDHWTFNSSYSKMLGWLANSAVNLFFVLSGFLIARILMREKQNATKGLLTSFYSRRFLRIFPLYYLSIALCLIYKIPSAGKIYIRCCFMSPISNLPSMERILDMYLTFGHWLSKNNSILFSQSSFY